jgi:hypothetical protein
VIPEDIAILGTIDPVVLDGSLASPVLEDGSLLLMVGGTYTASAGRPIEFTASNLPTGATFTLDLVAVVDGRVPVTATGTRTNYPSSPGRPAYSKLSFELTSAQTATLCVGDAAYVYRLSMALTDDSVITFLEGVCSVRE